MDFHNIDICLLRLALVTLLLRAHSSSNVDQNWVFYMAPFLLEGLTLGSRLTVLNLCHEEASRGANLTGIEIYSKYGFVFNAHNAPPAPPSVDSQSTLITVTRFYTALILIKKLISQHVLQWSCGVNWSYYLLSRPKAVGWTQRQMAYCRVIMVAVVRYYPEIT